MTPYALTHFRRDHADEYDLFLKIRMAIENLPDLTLDTLGPEGEVVKISQSCHIMARAASSVFRLDFKDGYYVEPIYSHSWLSLPSGNIIDVYPPQMICSPVIVLFKDISTPAKKMYVAMDRSSSLARSEERFGINRLPFLKAVETTRKELAEVSKRIYI